MRLPSTLQRWEEVTFLHWRYDPEVLRPLVPRSVKLDTCDGSAWLGMVLFRMRLAPPPFPAVFHAGSIPETNLRTYVTCPDGRRAVWFLSLDVASEVFALAARAALRLPYSGADMAIYRDGPTFRYKCTRNRSRNVRGHGLSTGHDITVRHGVRIASRSLVALDHFLTARYALLSQCGPLLVRLPIEHRPWVLRRATAMNVSETLVVAAGLPPPAGEPLVHGADAVDVRTGIPRPLFLGA